MINKPGTPERIEAGSQFEGALARLLVIMENYPQLQSIGTVKDLMVQLEGTENRISVARQRYNEAVQIYNTTLYKFPTNVVAGFMLKKPMPLFNAVEGAEIAPQVNLER